MFLISISVALCHLERQIEIDSRHIDQLAWHDNPSPKVVPLLLLYKEVEDNGQRPRRGQSTEISTGFEWESEWEYWFSLRAFICEQMLRLFIKFSEHLEYNWSAGPTRLMRVRARDSTPDGANEVFVLVILWQYSTRQRLARDWPAKAKTMIN